MTQTHCSLLVRIVISLTVHAYKEDDNRLREGVQLFVLLVPLVADLLFDFLPLLDEEGGNGSRQAQLRVDLADPRAGVHWQQILQHRANISYLPNLFCSS